MSFCKKTNVLDKELRIRERWRLSTDDTSLELGVSLDNKLILLEVSDPVTGWNWISQPSQLPLAATQLAIPRPSTNDWTSLVNPLPLVAKASTDGTPASSSWVFSGAEIDNSTGARLLLRFHCSKTALELVSEWWARPGAGPIRHAMTLHNRSDWATSVGCQPSLAVDLAGPPGNQLFANSIQDEGYRPRVGLCVDPIVSGYANEIICIADVLSAEDVDYIPLAIISDGDSQGVYIGVEWSICRIRIDAEKSSEGHAPNVVRVEAGNFSHFNARLEPGQTFIVPPAFIGAYTGDLDAMSNELHAYLFSYGMPEVVHRDNTYPKVRWNSLQAAAKTVTSMPFAWDSVGSKYHTLVDSVAALGFEEVVMDIGWWKDGFPMKERPMGDVPDADPEDWPNGIADASKHAHDKGMTLSLYWTDDRDMAVAADRNARAEIIRRLFREYGADVFRSDGVGGFTIGMTYWHVAGFYQMIDELSRDIPGFQWENCQGGGQIKDYGAMQRAVRIQNTDQYTPLESRQVFWSSSYAFHPIQLEGVVGGYDSGSNRSRRGDAAGIVYDFRSTSLGACMMWFDSPCGINEAPWTVQEKEALAAAVQCYKTRIRPLIRQADLYHILPRPDGKRWDGMEYYDKRTRKGIAYLFKPRNCALTETIPMKGLDPQADYRIVFEDGSNPPGVFSGRELMDGLSVTLNDPDDRSEILFFEAAK
jgi:hypothetical protein